MTGKVSRERLRIVWEEHVQQEFVERDVEATLATMTDDTSVTIVPLNVGGRGKERVRAFYRDILDPTVTGTRSPGDTRAATVDFGLLFMACQQARRPTPACS